MNRRTAIAIAAATITTLGTGAVTAAAVSGNDVLGLGNDRARLEIVAPTTSTDDNSPTSTRGSETETHRSGDDTTTTTSTTAPTNTRVSDDNPDRSTSTTTRTTAPPASPTSNTATFRSAGGEVDVTWTARTLSIVAMRPAAGFLAEDEESEGDEVEAEFESAAHNSKITVRLVNGAPSVSVRERDDSDRVGDDNSNSGHGSESNDDHGGSGRG